MGMGEEIHKVMGNQKKKKGCSHTMEIRIRNQCEMCRMMKMRIQMKLIGTTSMNTSMSLTIINMTKMMIFIMMTMLTTSLMMMMMRNLYWNQQKENCKPKHSNSHHQKLIIMIIITITISIRFIILIPILNPLSLPI